MVHKDSDSVAKSFTLQQSLSFLNQILEGWGNSGQPSLKIFFCLTLDKHLPKTHSAYFCVLVLVGTKKESTHYWRQKNPFKYCQKTKNIVCQLQFFVKTMNIQTHNNICKYVFGFVTDLLFFHFLKIDDGYKKLIRDKADISIKPIVFGR